MDVRVDSMVAELLGPQYRLRVTATCKLSVDRPEAEQQRRRVQLIMQRAAAALAAEGVRMEFLVGSPRSPEVLRTALAELAGLGPPLDRTA